MVKGEIAHHGQFHLRQQCFQKSSAAIAFKWVCRWERVNSLLFMYRDLPHLLLDLLSHLLLFILCGKVFKEKEVSFNAQPFQNGELSS